MVAIPEPRYSTASAIYGWREATADSGHRAHLGASILGHACERYLWLTFRWAARARWSGRMLRLFDTGKREEARVYEELRGIGCNVITDFLGDQVRVTFAEGHGGGSLDGVIVSGLPEAPTARHVLEIKTSSPDRFKALLKDGCATAQPQHYAQMQVYMHLAEIERALYFVVNKANDQIYTERVHYDREFAERMIARGERVVFADEPPPRISDRPDWWQCKSCTFAEHCHAQARPEVNCRTCAHATPVAEGQWVCSVYGQEKIPPNVQVAGCDEHRYIPALLHWAEHVGGDNDDNRVDYEYRGARFSNGLRGPRGFTSHELAALDPAMLADPNVEVLRMQFDGTATTAQ